MKKAVSSFLAMSIIGILLCGCGHQQPSSLSSATTENATSETESINTEGFTGEIVGEKIAIDVYVNDILIDTPVFKNMLSPPVDGPDNVGDYVLIESVCDAIQATFELSEESIVIQYRNKEYVIEKTFHDQENFIVINNALFVSFSSIRFAMSGSLKQNDEKSMYLYTNDFKRLDIPGTLEECYLALDKELDEETKKDIMGSVDHLIDYHFGLGMWIRNNWLYPANNRIAKVLLEMGYDHPDDMSYVILLGYHHYLNDLPFDASIAN